MKFDVTVMCRNYDCSNNQSEHIVSVKDPETSEEISKQLNQESIDCCEVCGELLVYYHLQYDDEDLPEPELSN